MDLRIARWGHSLAVRIPAEIVRRLDLHDGDRLDVRLGVDGSVTLRRPGWSRRAFAAELADARASLPPGRSVIDELRRESRY